MGTDVIRVKQTNLWLDPFGVPPCGSHSDCRPSHGSSAVSLVTREQWLVLGLLSMVSPLDLGVLSLGGHLCFPGLPWSIIPTECHPTVLSWFLCSGPYFSPGGSEDKYPKKRQLKLKHGALCSCGTLYDLTWGKVLSSFSSTGEEVDSDDSTDSPVSAFFNFLCCTRGKVMTDDQVPCHCFGALHWPSTEGCSL